MGLSNIRAAVDCMPQAADAGTCLQHGMPSPPPCRACSPFASQLHCFLLLPATLLMAYHSPHSCTHCTSILPTALAVWLLLPSMHHEHLGNLPCCVLRGQLGPVLLLFPGPRNGVGSRCQRREGEPKDPGHCHCKSSR